MRIEPHDAGSPRLRACATFGWLLSFALTVGVAAPLFGTCTQGDSAPWTASLLFFAPLGLIGLALAVAASRRGHPPRVMPWLHGATLALGVWQVPPYLWASTFGGEPVCKVREPAFAAIGGQASLLERCWAPGWVLILILLVLVVRTINRRRRE